MAWGQLEVTAQAWGQLEVAAQALCTASGSRAGQAGRDPLVSCPGDPRDVTSASTTQQRAIKGHPILLLDWKREKNSITFL